MAQPTNATQLAQISAKLDMLIEDVRGLKECINGNGHPGMKSDVATLQGKVETVKEQLNEHLEDYKHQRRTNMSLLYSVILSLIANVIATAFGLIK